MSGVRSVLLPGSLTMTLEDPRLSTYAIGTVGRALAIFGVEQVVVYEDPHEKGARLVSRILDYQSTAPYLRKRLFPISEELGNVGVLSPLNIPTHIVPAYVEEGQTRMAAMAGKRVDIGLEDLAELDLPEGEERPEPGKQFPVEVTATRSDRVLVRPTQPETYTGFSVHRTPDLATALKGRSPIVATSREGEAFDPDEHVPEEELALVFGTPERGFQDLIDQDPWFPVVNTIPNQRTRSVRVEEALTASLALFNQAVSRR